MRLTNLLVDRRADINGFRDMIIHLPIGFSYDFPRIISEGEILKVSPNRGGSFEYHNLDWIDRNRYDVEHVNQEKPGEYTRITSKQPGDKREIRLYAKRIDTSEEAR